MLLLLLMLLFPVLGLYWLDLIATPLYSAKHTSRSTMKVIRTFSFRIKDSTAKKTLCRMCRDVNFVWNYCNQTSAHAYQRNKQFLTYHDLHALTKGASKLLSINSQTIQAIAKEHYTRRKQHKRSKLRWRSRRRSLGWVPFNGQTARVYEDKITYNKQTFRFWKSRELPMGSKIKTGSFNQDARGRWYVNLQVEFELSQERGTKEARAFRTSWSHNSRRGISLGGRMERNII